jgi:putative DNA primase/helicase
MTAAIPSEMKALPQWVVWRYQTRKGKPSKPPYQSRDPKKPAKPDDPSTWSSYSEAVKAYSTPGHKLDGIGFMFGPGDPFAGVDFDNCLDDAGKALPWAQPYLDRLIGYAEVSPSGRGVKVFCRGSVPGGIGRKKEGLGPDGTGAIEIYDRGRYFTVTGREFEGRSDIGDGAEQLAKLHAELFPPEPKPTGKARVTPEPLDQTDADILDKIRQSRQGAKFEALFGGSTEGYGSQNQADLALCNILAFWFGNDVDAIDRVFRQSGLCREKWTERADYRDMTIGKAQRTWLDTAR